MDWFKKYNEKILLAGALLLLILVATVYAYKITTMATKLDIPEPGTNALALVDLGPYTNAIINLKAPPRWTNPNVATFFPPVIVETNVPVEKPKVPLFTLKAVKRDPFWLRFLAYSLSTKNNFQVNFLADDQQTVRRTFIIKNVNLEIADKFGKTGYKVAKFESKRTKKFNPTTSSTNDVDISELTLQHEGEQDIVLVLGKPSEHPKPFAYILCRDSTEPIKVAASETFTYGRSTYKVIDIKDTEVIIENVRSKRKLTLKLGVGVP